MNQVGCIFKKKKEKKDHNCVFTVQGENGYVIKWI